MICYVSGYSNTLVSNTWVTWNVGFFLIYVLKYWSTAGTHSKSVPTRTSSVCNTQGETALAAMQIPRAAIVKVAYSSKIGIKGPWQHALNKEGIDLTEISVACKIHKTRYTHRHIYKYPQITQEYHATLNFQRHWKKLAPFTIYLHENIYVYTHKLYVNPTIYMFKHQKRKCKHTVGS